MKIPRLPEHRPTITPPKRALVRDWPTVVLFVGCLAVWILALGLVGSWPLISFGLLVVSLVLHSSLTHEILHGAALRTQWACTGLGLVQPGLAIPYLRFRRLHLAHHKDANLTDPYDDPETNYLDPKVWGKLPAWQRMVLAFNNTLVGRMVVGPLVGQWSFMRDDLRRIRHGDQQVLVDWLLHLPGVVLILTLVTMSEMSWTMYFAAAYAALSILKIRTFLEHQAHARSSGRTVIVEDRWVLAFLFLNNNLHVVHHMHPTVAWYRLPALYRAHTARFRARNHGCVYSSYWAVFRQYFWRSKDPVAHPLWPVGKD